MRQLPLTIARLLCTDAAPAAGVASLAREFPPARVLETHGRSERDLPGEPIHDVSFDVASWKASHDFRTWDDAIDASGSEAITIRGAGRDVAAAAGEILTRYQRWIRRRNEASTGPVFDAVLAAHAELHDVRRPLVRADLDHALDTWQWMLRLDPEATLAAQLAALFHDVERLESEADRRVEHHAPDYQAFKDAHARRGADIAHGVLVHTGVDPRVAAHVRELVARHERRANGRTGDPAVDLLNDADGLSFFSLNSAGYRDYFGEAQTVKKIRWTLARLGPRARARIAGIRFRADVAPLVRAALADTETA